MKTTQILHNSIKTAATALCMLLSTAATAQSKAETTVESMAQNEAEVIAEPMDSIEISLLTCQPHDEVYSLYGHTAIRMNDMRQGHQKDVAFNYGIFDWKKPHFVARFVLGLTDYELGAYPFRLFLEEYRKWGSMVTEQVLNLTATEKQTLIAALAENMQPENRVYRYNYFTNNCTTKARDMIEQCINGKIQYAGREGYTPSYREMIHSMTERNLWARWGNDVLLGVGSDQRTDRRQQEFLPHNLLYDFDHASIYKDGNYRPLVKERRLPVAAGVQIHSEGFPLTPSTVGWILAAIGGMLFVLEWRRKAAYRLWDLLLMLTAGVIGLLLTVMIFSEHPTVSLNLQIILLNPLPWLFLWPVARGRKTIYWKVTAVLAVLYLLGGLIQTYPEGLWSLALCLLLQACIHIKREE